MTIISNLIGSCIVSLVNGWKLGLVGIACLPIMILSGYFQGILSEYFRIEVEKYYTESSRVIGEALGSIQTVHALSMQDYIYSKYVDIVKVPNRKVKMFAWKHAVFYAFSSISHFLVLGLTLWYGARLVVNDGYKLNHVYTTVAALSIGSMGIGYILAYLPDVGKAIESARAVFEYLDERPGHDQPVIVQLIRSTSDAVEIDDVEVFKISY
jgi:ATP-binding cassette subfamily B (MDR/TAP) protein 1